MGEWYAVQANRDVMCSDLGDGGILFDLNSKQYFSLNASAFFAWNVVQGGGSLLALESMLCASFPANGAEDPYGLRALAGFLREQRLVEPAGDVPAQATPGTPPSAWEPPRIEPHGNPLYEVILSPVDPTGPYFE
jgi:hypothetical protein